MPRWEVAMLDEAELLQTLRRHWEHPSEDEDLAHEIYRDDAVLEFPQSGERFEGVQNFREWRRQYPAKLEFHPRRINHLDNLVVTEYVISHRPRGCSPSASWSSRTLA